MQIWELNSIFFFQSPRTSFSSFWFHCSFIYVWQSLMVIYIFYNLELLYSSHSDYYFIVVVTLLRKIKFLRQVCATLKLHNVAIQIPGNVIYFEVKKNLVVNRVISNQSTDHRHICQVHAKHQILSQKMWNYLNIRGLISSVFRGNVWKKTQGQKYSNIP